MLVEALRLGLAVAMLVVLPGWLLSYALFPRRADLQGGERLYLIVAGGMLLLMSVALVLGFLPHSGDRGALQSLAIAGLPNVELGVLAVDLGLAWVAMRRGALARLGAFVPTSWRARATSRPPDPGS